MAHGGSNNNSCLCEFSLHKCKIEAKIVIFYDVLNLNTKMMMEKRLACVDDIKQNVNNLTTEKLNKYIHVQMATVWQPPETQKLHNFLLHRRPVPWLAALMPFVKMTSQFPHVGLTCRYAEVLDGFI